MKEVWVLVADRARARLFSLEEGASRMIEVADFVNPAARTPAHGCEHGPPPRVHDRIGEGRHVIEAHTPPREKVALQFAATLGTYLKHAHDELRYRGLILVAPPRFLGTLNATFGGHLGEAILLRVPKNLTRSPANEIREALPRKLFEPRTVATA